MDANQDFAAHTQPSASTSTPPSRPGWQGAAPRTRRARTTQAIIGGSIGAGLALILGLSALLAPTETINISQPQIHSGATDGSSAGDGAWGHYPSAGNSQGGARRATEQTTATTPQSTGVVLIDTTLNGAQAAGTGMVLKPDGTVLTNYHVVEASTSIAVTVVATGKTYSAAVLGDDPSADVALLKLDGASGLATVKLDTDGVTQGEQVSAVGNSQGQGYLSAATGTITATSATVRVGNESSSSHTETLVDVLQTSAAAVPGDSGGPLLDADNEVVGMTTAGEQASTSGGHTTTVASWAIPIARAMSVVQQIESGHPTSTVRIGPKAYLGVSVIAANTGAPVIEQVVAGGPADHAGLEPGETITSINGTTVTNQSGLSTELARFRPGDKVRLGYLNPDGTTATVTITLGSSPIN